MKHTINLLPKKSPEEERVKKKRQLTTLGFIVGAVLVAAMWLIPFLIVSGFRLQETRILSDIKTKEQSITMLSEAELLYRSVFGKTKAATLVFEQQLRLGKNIAKLEPLFAVGADLQSIALNDKDRVKLAVTTFDSAAIFTYLTELENETTLASFADLTVSSISIDPTGGYIVKIDGGLVP